MVATRRVKQTSESGSEADDSVLDIYVPENDSLWNDYATRDDAGQGSVCPTVTDQDSDWNRNATE